MNVFVRHAFVSEAQMNEAKHCFSEAREMNVNKKGAAERKGPYLYKITLFII